MIHRNRFGAMAMTVAGLFALASAGPAAADDKAGHHEHFMKCAKVCADCQIQCDMCFVHCRAMLAQGKKEHEASLQLCADCAEFCKLAATLSARMSPLSMEACDSCAKACDKCAESCEKFPADKHMAACAKSCRDCAKACREMIQHLKH